jgi:hypothetical protein
MPPAEGRGAAGACGPSSSGMPQAGGRAAAGPRLAARPSSRWRRRSGARWPAPGRCRRCGCCARPRAGGRGGTPPRARSRGCPGRGRARRSRPARRQSPVVDVDRLARAVAHRVVDEVGQDALLSASGRTRRRQSGPRRPRISTPAWRARRPPRAADRTGRGSTASRSEKSRPTSRQRAISSFIASTSRSTRCSRSGSGRSDSMPSARRMRASGERRSCEMPASSVVRLASSSSTCSPMRLNSRASVASSAGPVSGSGAGRRPWPIGCVAVASRASGPTSQRAIAAAVASVTSAPTPKHQQQRQRGLHRDAVGGKAHAHAVPCPVPAGRPSTSAWPSAPGVPQRDAPCRCARRSAASSRCQYGSRCTKSSSLAPGGSHPAAVQRPAAAAAASFALAGVGAMPRCGGVEHQRGEVVGRLAAQRHQRER